MQGPGARARLASRAGNDSVRLVIDHQAHWYPKALFDAFAQRDAHPRCSRQGSRLVFEPQPDVAIPIRDLFVDLELQLDDMDRNGVDAMLSSPGFIGDVGGLEAAEARELAILVNEEYASAQTLYPGRFLGLATLPMQDPQAALEVLDDAVQRLGLRGICLHSNIGGRAICTPETWPVYERLEQLRMPIVLHPTRSVAAAPFDAFGREIDVIAGWLFDTSAAALSLIFSGTLDEFPHLTILHPHLGGVLPFIAARIAGVEHLRPGGRSTAQPALEYLRDRFYVDTVSGDPGALRLALDLYGPERTVFGSDLPWLERAAAVEFVRANLPAPEAQSILANALPLAQSLTM